MKKYSKILILIFIVIGILFSSDNVYFSLSKTDYDKKLYDYSKIDELDRYLSNITRKKRTFINIINKKTVVSFGGDILMDSYFADYIKWYGVDYSWTEVSDLFHKSDISFVNLETSVSEKGSTKKPEGYAFRSKPYTLEGLKNADIDLVVGANNHILDFGEGAFLDTIKYLEEYNIEYSGIGKNIYEAEELKIIEKNGLIFGFLSYNSILPWDSWKADIEKPGPAYLDYENYENVRKNIEKYDNKCDILVINLHWGVEYSNIPEDYQIKIAHDLVDAGGDLIVGHHPHVLQGIEIYKGKPIFYSIGNFIFLKMDEEAGKTALFQLEFDKSGFNGGIIHPVHINHCKANLLSEDNPMKEDIIITLQKLSKDFGTAITDKGEIKCKID